MNLERHSAGNYVLKERRVMRRREFLTLASARAATGWLPEWRGRRTEALAIG